MLTDLRSPNIDAPSECGRLHGGPTSSKMAVMLGGSFGPSRPGVVIAANRFKRSKCARLPASSRRFPRFLRLLPQLTLRMLVARFGRRVVRMDLIVILLVVLIVLALVGSVAVSPLLWALVVVLVLFAVLGRGRYYGRRG